MKKLLLFSLVCYLISCNGNGCNGDNSPIEYRPLDKPYAQRLNMDDIIEARGSVLPDICTVVPMFEIANVLGVPEYDIYISDNNPRVKDPIHTSCFFKWTDSVLSNAGIFMRAERNPYPEEFPDYLIEFIKAKKTTGEQFVDPNMPPIIYSDFLGIGDDGAYNVDEGSYFWRLDNKIAFRLSFNTTHTPEQQYKMAQQLAVIVVQYYLGEK